MKKMILIMVLLLFVFPKGVFAYSTIKYYDFAYVMNELEYDIEVDKNDAVVIAYNGETNEKYYFYEFFNPIEAKFFVQSKLNRRLEDNENIEHSLELKNNYSSSNMSWFDGTTKYFEYCFGTNGAVVCGIADIFYKEKVKENVDDLFRDDIGDRYYLNNVHEKIKGIDNSNVNEVMKTLDFVLEEGKDSNEESDSYIQFLLLLSIFVILFGLFVFFSLKRKKKVVKD